MKKTIVALLFTCLVIFSCAKIKNPTQPVINTVTPANTQTLTVSASPSPAATGTSVDTATLTMTPVNTDTPTNVETDTATPSDTETITQSFTETITQTATVTQTITDTDTMTITVTITQTPTSTATITSTATTIPFSEMAPVPGGTFMQSDGAEIFSHTVSAFKLCKYEVTYDLWYAVYQWGNDNGYTFQNPGMEGSAGSFGVAPTAARYHPVTTINWRDMIVWCNAYSQMMGLVPVYYTDAAYSIILKSSASGAYGGSIDGTPGSFDNPFVDWSSNGYRLPTEGEWQYAASYIDGNTWTPYNYASGASADFTDAAATGLVAWYQANSGDVTHDVGGKAANDLGIYDMSGNVWEFCWDWYASYPGASADYKGPASASYRVGRGGSYFDPSNSEVVGGRGADSPWAIWYYYYAYSFRVASRN